MSEPCKYCKRCDRWLPLACFYRNRTRPDGRQCFCKTCWLADCTARKQRNPERRRAIVRKFHLSEKGRRERHRSNAKRRAAIAGAAFCEVLPKAVRLVVWAKCDGRCFYCGSQERLEHDHMVPISRGGEHAEHNIVVCCEVCNLRKGTMTAAEFVAGAERRERD